MRHPPILASARPDSQRLKPDAPSDDTRTNETRFGSDGDPEIHADETAEVQPADKSGLSQALRSATYSAHASGSERRTASASAIDR